MERSINVSEQLYTALQHQASRDRKSVDHLAEDWLRQHLSLARFPELDWRQGPGGWRVGVQGTAIDVYTIAGYIHAGYTPQEIADDLLPQLTPQQVSAALRYYAEYPDEIDSILADSDTESVKTVLKRALGTAAYQRLVGSVSQTVREDSDPYKESDERD